MERVIATRAADPHEERDGPTMSTARKIPAGTSRDTDAGQLALPFLSFEDVCALHDVGAAFDIAIERALSTRRYDDVDLFSRTRDQLRDILMRHAERVRQARR